MKIILGGTFSPFHIGHEALISEALEEGDVIFIGLTSDRMARSNRTRSILPFEERKKRLKTFCDEKVAELGRKCGRNPEYHVRELDDFYALTPESEDADAIVVSFETRKMVARINEVRALRSLKPYRAIIVPYILAQDGRSVKASRIAAGEIDRNGKLLRSLRVNLGSKNPVKVRATEVSLLRMFDEVVIASVDVDSGVGKQPKGDETITGAVNRAKRALETKIKGEQDTFADFGIGIEAGLFWKESIGEYVDIQFCAITDLMGRTTIGHGGGFIYPRSVIDEVEGGMSVGEAISEVFGSDPSRDIGAVGLLSDGLLTREELTKMAVITAMIPRISQNRGYIHQDEDGA